MIVRRRTAIAACLLVALTPVSAGISPGRLRAPRVGEVHRQDAEVSSPREHWVQRLLRLLAPSGNNALRRSLVKSAGWLRSPTVAAAIAATASYRTHLRSVAQKRKVQQEASVPKRLGQLRWRCSRCCHARGSECGDPAG